MYLHRAIEQTIVKAEHQTKAVLITGARQDVKIQLVEASLFYF